jgi:hypothetical protein
VELGILLYSLLEGESLFGLNETEAILEKVAGYREDDIEFPMYVSKHADDLI